MDSLQDGDRTVNGALAENPYSLSGGLGSQEPMAYPVGYQDHGAAGVEDH
jgi:hypothetical protein